MPLCWIYMLDGGTLHNDVQVDMPETSIAP